MNKESRYFLYILIIFFGFLSFKILSPYISLVILGFIVVGIFSPFYNFALKKLNNNVSLATGVSIVFVFLSFLVPLIFLGIVTINQGQTFYQDLEHVFAKNNRSSDQLIIDLVDYTNKTVQALPLIDFQLTNDKLREFVLGSISTTSDFIIQKSLGVGAGIVGVLGNMLIFIFVLAALFPSQQNFINYLVELSPLEDHIDRIYIKRFLTMSKGMIKGSLVIAVVQGLASGLIFALIGIPYVVFWTILMIFLSLIPLGAGVINLPAGIIMILLGNYWQGITIIVLHILVITNIDNVLRAKLASADTELHPLLTLLSVLGGIQYFGIFGFIYGPVIMLLLVTSFEVYKRTDLIR